MFRFYFFYLYRDHRDLHSFPTRRSSDLTGFSRPAHRSHPGTATAWSSAFRRLARRPAMCLLKTELRPELPPSPGGSAEKRDRKSTRLNSSHITISYAVFCLKKKTNNHSR